MKTLIKMTDYKFKEIPHFENYMISECGKIIYKKSYTDAKGNVRKLKIISQHIKKDGYVNVVLNKNGKATNFNVHVLVGITFVPNPFNKPQINHKDNLEWCTDKENKEHAILKGLTAKGERNGNSVLTLEKVLLIKKDLETGMYKNTFLAQKYNVSTHNISDIKNKRTWNH